jgi:hypothetical protein
MFWTSNINELFKPALIPTDYMTMDEKLNTLTRLIIFVCLLVALVLQDMKIILLMIILVLFIVLLQRFSNANKEEIDAFLNENKLQVIDNKVCVKPTKDNPFMNPSLLDIKEDDDAPKACPITNVNVATDIDEIYNSTMFRNVDDIYDRSTSRRQFYSVPASTIPNDQTTFANWLYKTGKSCKENNGDQCYKNMYSDVKR